jgi:hypothetical protein
MEPFPLLLFLVPLIGYLATLSLIRLSGRVFVTSGGCELAALAFAISGMIAVGPAELFFPMAASAVFGPLVWGVLAIFYALCVCLVALGSIPKVVVYGCQPRDLYEPLLRAARSLDKDAEGREDQLQVVLPGSGVHLKLDGPSSIEHASVVAFEANLTPFFWRSLLKALRNEVTDQRSPRIRALPICAVTISLTTLLIYQCVSDKGSLISGFNDWLWR